MIALLIDSELTAPLWGKNSMNPASRPPRVCRLLPFTIWGSLGLERNHRGSGVSVIYLLWNPRQVIYPLWPSSSLEYRMKKMLPAWKFTVRMRACVTLGARHRVSAQKKNRLFLQPKVRHKSGHAISRPCFPVHYNVMRKTDMNQIIPQII